MIKTKNDLKEYLLADKRQLNISRKRPYFFGDEIWKYEINLRKYEYWTNKKGFFARVFKYFYKFKHHRNMVKYGFAIDPNCVGKGLAIVHLGTIRINGDVKIGENLRIQEGVTIGASGGGVPQLGNNIFLASGCKVMGPITIADNVAVGANAVVVKDVIEPGITVGGVPAKKISNKNSHRYVFWFNNGEPI